MYAKSPPPRCVRQNLLPGESERGIILFTMTGNLVNMISYQDAAVVSKEIIKKETGTITLFAFDRGQGLSEHTAPFDAFVYILDGEASVTIEGQAHTVKAGEMIVMPANKPHALSAVKKFKMLLVMIKK